MKERLYIRSLEYFLKSSGYLGILYFSLAYFVVFYQNSIYFSGAPTDGPFQLFNALRRWEDGQIPGVDFPFFHGIGVLYLHYPFFALWGKSLFASEMSRNLLSPLFFLMSAYCFFYVCTKNKALSLFSTAFTLYFAMPFMDCLFHSATSILGVRSAIPLFAGIYLIFYLGKKNTTRKQYLFHIFAIAILIGFSFLCAIEQGMACLAAYCIFSFSHKICQSSIKKALRETASEFVACIFCILVLFFLLCGKNFPIALKYYLSSLPGDQFWYFGIPPSPFLSSFQDIAGYYHAQNPTFISILYGIFLFVITCYANKKKPDPALQGISFLLLYGLFSTVSIFGIYSNVYCQPLIRIEFLATLYYLLVFIPLLWQRLQVSLIYTYRGFLLLAFTLCIPYFSVPNLFYHLENFLHLPKSQEKKISGVYLSPSWHEHIALVDKQIQIPFSFQATEHSKGCLHKGIEEKKPALVLDYSKSFLSLFEEGKIVLLKKSGKRSILKVETFWENLDGIRKKYIRLHLDGGTLCSEKDGYPHRIFLLEKGGRKPTVWSTYSSLVETLLEEYHPDTDYIIHALGKKRREKYLETFLKSKCDYAITIKNQWLYGNWLLQAHWDFYESLIDNYDILCQTPSHLLWKRKENPCSQAKIWEGTIQNLGEKNEAILPLNRTQEKYDVVVVHIEYEIQNPWRSIPFLQYLPRYFVDPVNAQTRQVISLPPYYTEFSFPVFIKSTENPKLYFSVRSLVPYTTLHVKKLSYRYLHSEQKTKEKLFGVFR